MYGWRNLHHYLQQALIYEFKPVSIIQDSSHSMLLLQTLAAPREFQLKVDLVPRAARPNSILANRPVQYVLPQDTGMMRLTESHPTTLPISHKSKRRLRQRQETELPDTT